MPTDRPTGTGRTTSNGRTAKRRADSRITIASSDALDTDQLLAVLTAVRKGDFSVKMPMSQTGVAGKISDVLNDILELNRETTREFERVSQAVGKEGKITQRAQKSELLRRQTQLLVEGEQAALELAEARAELIRDLEHKNRELESFSYAVSHDLRAPLRRIDCFSRAVLESQGERLDEQGRRYLERVREASQHMSQLIDDVLYLSRVTRADLRDQEVGLSALAALILSRLQEGEPARKVEIKVRPGVVVTGDGQLLRIALENLLENAWKFTSNQPESGSNSA